MNEEKHYCVYCGQPAKFQFKNGKWCCSKNQTSCPAIKKSISSKAKQMWIDTKEQGATKLEERKVRKTKKEQIIPYICTFCGKEAKYQLKNGKWCCSPSYNQCPELRRKNSEKIKSMYSDDGKIFNGKLRAEQYTEESRLKQGWAKGKTKFTNKIIKERGERLSKKYKNGELVPSQLGRNHSTEEIDKIIHGMTHYRSKRNLKGFKKGWYKGYWCDSSWELAFVMYNIDHKIKFIRNEKGFLYYNDRLKKERRFYPDFIINNEYIEIKGWNNDDTISKQRDFPKDQKLKIYFKEDMEEYLKYAIEKYGLEFWKLLSDENNF